MRHLIISVGPGRARREAAVTPRQPPGGRSAESGAPELGSARSGDSVRKGPGVEFDGDLAVIADGTRYTGRRKVRDPTPRPRRARGDYTFALRGSVANQQASDYRAKSAVRRDFAAAQSFRSWGCRSRGEDIGDIRGAIHLSHDGPGGTLSRRAVEIDRGWAEVPPRFRGQLVGAPGTG